MRVAIITLTKVYNYGNSLQNYALQTVLQKKGLNPETILFKNDSIMNIVKYRFKKFIKDIIKLNNNAIEKKRKKLFDGFDCEYIKFSKKRVFSKICKAEKRYDYYIVGSDQVWNANWYKNHMKDIYLLTFTSDEKKIAYSASFGTEIIPDEWREWFKYNLLKFKAVSVREEKGQQIILDLLGRKVQRLVDPTLMISPDNWRKLEKQPICKSNSDYILTYFLGEESDDVRKIIDKNADAYEVISLNRYSENIVAGPAEFLWLIDNAKLILTDSFHGSVFSFIFDRPFLVFNRNDNESSMNSRIVSFLKLFGLDRKYYGNHLENDIWEHDYNEGYDILKDEIQKANCFIDNNLDIII